MDFDSIPFRETSHRGISIHVYRQDPHTRRTAILIRMEPGCSYPAHRHNGTEELLVLRGGYRDELGTHHSGSFVRYEDGSSHHPTALEGDSDCILFAISEHGIDLNE